MNRKKFRYLVLTIIIILLFSFLILCLITAQMYSPKYLCRVLTHWDSDIADCDYFPKREISAGESAYQYTYNLQSDLENIDIAYKNGDYLPLTEFVSVTDTTSFIIVKNDTVIYEQYANGYTKDSVNTSFSMSKSVVSLLIGKAIEDGYIQDVHQPISDFIPELLDTKVGSVTIEELLLMRSDIEYDETKPLWFGDDALTYWHPNLRKLALENTKISTDKNANTFCYNNYHPLLLGIVLEKSTGMYVSDYFAEKIWKPIGAEYNASWSLDSEEYKFEKLESGINFRAIDFVKIGSMVLHNGNWNGTQIIDKNWLSESTLSEFPLNFQEYENTFLEDRNIGYKYMWYSLPAKSNNQFDIVAWGKSDQVLYISPENNIVILRTGKSDGGVSDWIKILQSIANEL